jgi:hypothetical protein|tara:strand:- start:79 stop:561 length:483 start_codon:yes stop_codon:yes gene_type:complete
MGIQREIYVDEKKVGEKHFNPLNVMNEIEETSDKDKLEELNNKLNMYDSMDLYFGQLVEVEHKKIEVSTKENVYSKDEGMILTYRLVLASTFSSYKSKNADKLIKDFLKSYGEPALDGRKIDQFGFLEEKKKGRYVLHGVDYEDLTPEVMRAFLDIKMKI